MQINQYDIVNYKGKMPECLETSLYIKSRPFVVVSNNACNFHSPIITCVPLSTKLHKEEIYAPKVNWFNEEVGQFRLNVAHCEQLFSLNKEDCIVIGSLLMDSVAKIQKSLKIQLGV